MDDRQLFELKRRLAGILDTDVDQVRYYPLCQRDIPEVLIDGPGRMSMDVGYTMA